MASLPRFEPIHHEVIDNEFTQEHERYDVIEFRPGVFGVYQAGRHIDDRDTLPGAIALAEAELAQDMEAN